MRAVAFGDDGYTADLAHAFAAGAQRHGVRCDVRCTTWLGLPACVEVVWMYGMHSNEWLFKAHQGIAPVRVVGDLGYWREDAAQLPMYRRPVRISINSQQPDTHLRLRVHPLDRFAALGLAVDPVARRGDAILICGHDPIQAARHGLGYGQWERRAAERVRRATLRDIVIREKPGCERMAIEGTRRNSDKDIGTAIRAAHAVVCLTGNVGADAILHGVPVFARNGPGAVYERARIDWIDDAVPMAPARRLAALSDLAYWQWTPEEFASGELWAHLKQEVLR